MQTEARPLGFFLLVFFFTEEEIMSVSRLGNNAGKASSSIFKQVLYLKHQEGLFFFLIVSTQLFDLPFNFESLVSSVQTEEPERFLKPRSHY